MSWTDDRVEKLKSLWNEGMSASQIAKELGGVTRNAVIGKVHRLGLSSRTSGGGSTAKTAKDAKPKKTEAAAPKAEAAKPRARKAAETAKPKPATAAKAAKPKAEAQNEAEGFSAETPALADDPSTFELPSENQVDIASIDRTAMKLGLLDLTERTCKWPIGDPSRGEFYFCGQPAEVGKPYCQGHSSAAFQPMSSRRDRERMRNANRPAITR